MRVFRTEIKGKIETDVNWIPSSREVKQLLIPSVLHSTIQIPKDYPESITKDTTLCYSWNHYEAFMLLKTEFSLAPLHLRQPISSESSKQSLVPSHLQDAAIQCPSSQRKCSLSHSAIPQATENQFKKKLCHTDVSQEYKFLIKTKYYSKEYISFCKIKKTFV